MNAVIYYGDSLELSDPIQVSFLGPSWSCQCTHVCMSKNAVNCNSVTVELPKYRYAPELFICSWWRVASSDTRHLYFVAFKQRFKCWSAGSGSDVLCTLLGGARPVKLNITVCEEGECRQEVEFLLMFRTDHSCLCYANVATHATVLTNNAVQILN